MRSSSGFVFAALDFGRPIQTRFRYGYAAAPLNLAKNRDSPDHYAKGTPSLAFLAERQSSDSL